jgi:uncharacterized membrane protein
MVPLNEAEKRFVQAVGFLSGLCIFFYTYRVLMTQSFRFEFIFGNLALAWLGLIFGWLLVRKLKSKRWTNWESILLTVLWLMFLPNTWYVLTDFLHVLPLGEISQLYDIVLVSTLVINGFVLGFASLFLVHKEFLKRLGENKSMLVVTLIILLSSFAIYLGRDLRWNSWDVITNPSSIILNVSDRVIDPLGHPRAINVTGLFFILIASTYFAFWTVINPVKPRRNSD